MVCWRCHRAIVAHIRRIRPQVIVTFGPDGAYGHPDHIAISQFTTAAIVCAADSEYRLGDGSEPDSLPPHRVAKCYYLAWPASKWAAYEAALRKLTFTVDGVERQATPWPEWAVTTKLDVDIPAGIADEQRIRLTGRGHAGERGGPPGDLYVLVRVAEDERFIREGQDLITPVDVAAPFAALGTVVSVPTLDGEEEVDIPSGTQPGTTSSHDRSSR